MSNSINTGDNMVSNNNRRNNALLFLKVAPNTTVGDDGVLSIAFNFDDKEQVEHYRKAATSILNWIDMNEQASGGNATVRTSQVRRYKTPEGKPLLPAVEFSAMRIEDNKERGFSECNFQRQTGRTTAMVLKALEFVKENAMGEVLIEVHNQGMRKRVKELLLHYADEMGVGHRAHARIFTKTPSENISGIDIGLQLRDNVFDDTKENP